MIAFVLSGGGNYGAMQAGALQALTEQGIKPDLIIGTSAGALNGSQLAYDYSPESAKRMVRLWTNLNGEVIYPGGYPTALFRVAQGKNGLFSNRNLQAFVDDNLPPDATTFGDLRGAKLYVVATEIPSGKLTIFGEDPADSLRDALLAGSALPPLHPPYHIGDKAYVDGSLASKFPLKIAIEKGATTIYALHIHHNPAERPFEEGIVAISRWSINKLLHDLDEAQLAWAKSQRGVNLHYIQLKSPLALAATDFSHSETLAQRGYLLTMKYLNSLPPTMDEQIETYLGQINRQLHHLPTAVKGFLQQRFSPAAEATVEASTEKETEL